MELNYVHCRKQTLVLISCLILLYLSSLNTITTESTPNSTDSKNRSHKVYCPKNWLIGPSKTKCYAYFRNYTTWEKSEMFCSSKGSHLASILSNKDLSFVQKLCNGNNNSCWIGGRSLNSSSSSGFRWTWSDPKSPQWNQTMFPKVLIRARPCGHNGDRSCYDDMCLGVTNGSVPVFGERCNASHAFICAVNSDLKCRNCHGEYLIILLVVSGLILFTTFAIILWFLIYKRSKKRQRSRKVSNPTSSALVPPLLKIFTSEELRSMTKNFSEANRLAGDAKTGGTYSGCGLSDGMKVAVKRLKRSSFQRKKEFYSEIRRAAKLQHPHVVAIKGCCYDHGDRFIVYEFIANGPLDRWLHHVPRGGRSLDWNMRLNIATTLAQGIAFLHDKVKPQVVHRDIRASNVLLDEDFGAHLMGVGLSKFVPWEVMQERTVMAGGTYGYLAPEYVYRNELTTKSDVYSFGVLLLEIVSGRRPTQAVNSSVGWQSIFEWATPLVQTSRWLEILDPVINCGLPDASVVQKVVDLVYSCTQNVPSMRPRMSHVVHQLQQLVPPVSEIERIKISHVHVHRRPVPSIDMTMLVTLKVSNADVYSFDFTALDVAIGYRGKTLGHVSSDGGHVTAMGLTYLEAETELDGVTVFDDVIHLIHDFAKGSIEFDTVTVTNGKLGILFFRFPLKAKVACGILVNTVNQTISRQSCRPV
ncbi:unnamed protein product [Cochlearia groenlandica]